MNVLSTGARVIPKGTKDCYQDFGCLRECFDVEKEKKTKTNESHFKNETRLQDTLKYRWTTSPHVPLSLLNSLGVNVNISSSVVMFLILGNC